MLSLAPDYDHLMVIQKVEVFEHALESTSGEDLHKVWGCVEGVACSLQIRVMLSYRFSPYLPAVYLVTQPSCFSLGPVAQEPEQRDLAGPTNHLHEVHCCHVHGGWSLFRVGIREKKDEGVY